MEEHPAHQRRTEGSGHKHGHQQFICRGARFNLEDDLILPDATWIQLRETLTKLRHHKTIYEDWEFASVDPVGRGTILNFYGPPGTGKSMAGEALAGTLKLPLIHIGIAELESKFLGETAKNIQAAFHAAHERGAVLFFDEADTLLGARLTSVTQGIDNEVNSMRSTMLIELERFEGIAIFASNFARNYDEAFRSRITSHIRFDLPDLRSREKLWRKMLIQTIPVSGDRELLIQQCAESSDGFSGREIRTCMRLSLPKAILDSESNGQAPLLSLQHLLDSIGRIKSANQEVGTSRGRSAEERESVRAAKSLLGV